MNFPLSRGFSLLWSQIVHFKILPPGGNITLQRSSETVMPQHFSLNLEQKFVPSLNMHRLCMGECFKMLKMTLYGFDVLKIEAWANLISCQTHIMLARWQCVHPYYNKFRRWIGFFILIGQFEHEIILIIWLLIMPQCCALYQFEAKDKCKALALIPYTLYRMHYLRKSDLCNEHIQSLSKYYHLGF